MEPKCQYEQFEFTPYISNMVAEFQETAKRSAKKLANNKTPLLVYWADDNLWYYCTIVDYNEYADKSLLTYDDGVQESIHLWEEKFITVERYNQIKHKLEPSKRGYERFDSMQQEYPSMDYYAYHSDMRPGRMLRGGKEHNYPPQMAKRSYSKDTNGAKSARQREPTNVKIDNFVIVERELDPDDDDSFLSDEKSYEEYEEKIAYDKSPQAEFADKKKNTFASQVAMGNGMQFSQDQHHAVRSKTNMMSEGKHMGHGEYLGERNYRNKEMLMAPNHHYGIDESSNYVIRNGPFEISKNPDAKIPEVNTALQIEKEE